MKFPIIFLLCSLALVGGRAAEPSATSQTVPGTPWAFRTWSEDVVLPPGGYHANTKTVQITDDRKITVGPGCVVERVHFAGDKNLTWNVSGSFFREVPIEMGNRSRFQATDSAFESCGMTKSGTTVLALWSTRWRFENCVFAGKFMTDSINIKHFSMHAERCSFHHLDLPKIGYELPRVGWTEDSSNAPQSSDLQFFHCRFVECAVPESFLAATVDGVFEDCTFSPERGNWARSKKPINVTAYVVSRNKPPADFENGVLKVTFKTTTAPAAGSSSRTTLVGGHLTPTVKTTGPAMLIGNLETAPAVASAAPSPPSPTPAGPPPRIFNKDDLLKFLLTTGWTWERANASKEKLQFFDDGTARHRGFTAKFEVLNSFEVELRLGKEKTRLTFDAAYTRYDGLDFNSQRPVFGLREAREPLAAATPDPAPAPAAAGAPLSDPVSRELVKTYRTSLVFVSGADGAGSGFVAALGGSNFLFTNAHVAAGIKGAGFKALDGSKVPVGAAASAVGHDIFRLQLGPGGTRFEVMQGVDEKVTIDDEIVILGNAEGAGVINPIKGRIVGVGPQLVEVDAPFQPGNSGSPIVHLKTGQVIGVATYLTIKKYDAATREVLKAPVIRRFGYRLDSVTAWQPVNWPAFYAQAAEMQSIEALTSDLGDFLVDLGKDGKVTQGAHSNPAIKTRIDQWLGDKRKRLNAKDAATVDQNFISFLKVACQSDIAAARPRMSYDYFQRQLTSQQQERAEIAVVFDKIIKDLQQGR